MPGPGGREVGRVSIRVVPDTGAFSTELLAELKAIEAKTLLNIRAELDAAGLAEHTRMAVADAERTAGKVHIQTELDNRAAMSSASQLGSSINGIVAAAITLGPALVPVAAGLAAVFGAVSVPLVAAGAGLSAFGVLAIPLIHDVIKQSKALQKAQLAVNDAITDKAKQTALEKQAALIASLNPMQTAAVESLNKMKDAFHAMQAQLAPDIFKVFNAGLDLIVVALPAIGQLARAVAPALASIATDLANAFKSPALQGFVDFLAGRAAGAIEGFARGIGYIAQGFASMLIAFGPLSDSINSGIGGMLRAFSTIGASNGFTAFIAYVVDVGPRVAAFFSAFVAALVNVTKALAPIGVVVLQGLTLFLQALAAMPTGVLTVVLGSIVAIVAGIKAWAVAQVVLNVAMAAFTLITSPFLLIFVGLAVTIAAVVAAVALLAVGVYELIKHWQDVINFFTTTVPAAFQTALGAVSAAFSAIGQLVSAAAGVVGRAVGAAVDAVVGFFQALPGRAVSALSALPGLLATAATVAGKALLEAIAYGLAAMVAVFILLPARVVAALIDLAPRLVVVANTAWRAFLDATGAGLIAIVTFIAGLPVRTLNALVAFGPTLAGVARAAWAAFRSYIVGGVEEQIRYLQSFPGNAARALSALGSAIAAVAAAAFRLFRGAISSGSDDAVQTARALPGRLLDVLSGLVQSYYNAGRAIIQGLANGITSMVGVVRDAVANVMEKARSLLPFSPAKEGPFSGRGWTTYSGASIVDGLVEGINSRTASAVRATTGVASAVSDALNIDGTATSASGSASSGADFGALLTEVQLLRAEVRDQQTRQVMLTRRARAA